jgi:amino acid transporter
VTVVERARAGRQTAVKRVLIGRRHPSSHLPHTLLPKILALPIFSSDPLSSVAYATEQIMVVLLATSASSRHVVLPIALVIGATLAIVVISYRQTVRAYPSGGGSYVVSKENLGTFPGLVAAAALLVDYVLTVSVSVVAGVVAIVGAASGLGRYTTEISIACVILLTLVNLRGVRETGPIFAVPTYAFVCSIFALLAVGFLECATSGCPSASSQHVQAIEDLARNAGPLSLFVILHAFSSGSTALTGVEAISNAVPAFKRPQSQNAATTLAVMAGMSITMFLGISWLAVHVHGVVPPGTGQRSVVGQMAFAVFHGGLGFYTVQVFTAAILILAANTSYQGFPRLSSILARDRYLPRQFMNRGDRLVFSNGVVVLATLSCLLIWALGASLDALIQLYLIGVFTAFTLSQAGMVVHWRRVRGQEGVDQRRVRISMAINSVGAVCTGVVLVIITWTKFTEGAWISLLAMGGLILIFMAIHRHYSVVGRQLRGRAVTPHVPRNDVVLLVPSLDRATVRALGYAKAINPTALHAVSLDGGSEGLRRKWIELSGNSVKLQMLSRRNDDLLDAVRAYLARISRGSGDFVTVILPELITDASLPRYLLDSRRLVRLKAGLLRERRIAVADVPVLAENGATGPPEGVITPRRTVALVFVSGVHDAAIRAVNYARSLQALETHAVYFALDHGEIDRIIADWFDRDAGIPLDIVDAPFRDLTGPMLTEVRLHTAKPGTVVALVIPELIPKRPLSLLVAPADRSIRETALSLRPERGANERPVPPRIADRRRGRLPATVFGHGHRAGSRVCPREGGEGDHRPSPHLGGGRHGRVGPAVRGGRTELGIGRSLPRSRPGPDTR